MKKLGLDASEVLMVGDWQKRDIKGAKKICIKTCWASYGCDSFNNKIKADFEMEKTIVKRIISLAKPFKKEANDKTHSWYHIVRKKKEIDDIDIQNIIDLINKLEETISK